MRNVGIVVFIVLAQCVSVHYATGQDRENIMKLAGVVYAEELGEEEVERWDELLSRPVRINVASRSRLAASGLFSQYQIASLIDYRSRNGDILSVSELAAVDGFGKEYADMIAPFVSLVSFSLPGRSSVQPLYVDNRLTIRSSVKMQGTEKVHEAFKSVPQYNYGMKYRFSMNDRLDAGITARNQYDERLVPPDAASFFVAYYGRGVLGKVVLGDFNARFGQGLSMWSGFSMSGVPAYSAFAKKFSGISPYWSYSGSGSHRGVAADFNIGSFMLSAFAAVPGLRDRMSMNGKDVELAFLPGLNIAWFGMNGQASLTCFLRSCTADAFDGGASFTEECKMSADVRYSVRGVEIFSEAAIDLLSFVPAALAGCRFSPCRGLDMAAGLRYYPEGYVSGYSGAMRSGSKCTNEYGVSFSGSFMAGGYVQLRGKTGFGSSVVRHQGSFSIDLSHSPQPKYRVKEPSSQYKAVFSYSCQLFPSFALVFRMSERIRTYGEKFRTDIRCDFRYSSGSFSSSIRLNALRCSGLGLLSYAECGYRDDRFSAYLRGGLFKVDDWDDRIYAYERDAPGNFSVPAYYGRGFWTAFTAGTKIARWGRVYLRASYTGYPARWRITGKIKPGKAEFKVQFVFDI